MISSSKLKNGCHRTCIYLQSSVRNKNTVLNLFTENIKMAQKTEGIQQLLIAEKKATDRVHEARKRKASRLKTAKKEAEAEINAYKDHREKLYKNAEQAAAGKHGSAETEIAAITNKQIIELEIAAISVSAEPCFPA